MARLSEWAVINEKGYVKQFEILKQSEKQLTNKNRCTTILTIKAKKVDINDYLPPCVNLGIQK